MKLPTGMPNEPPDWWKRWRPLRWLAGFLLLGLLVSVLKLWWHPAAPAEAPAVAAAAPAVAETAASEAVPAALTAETPAADTAAASATPAVPEAAPAPVAEAPPAPSVAQETAVVEEPITVSEMHSAYTAVLPEAQRLSFFAPFRSYAGVDEVHRLLEQAGYEPQETSSHARTPEGVPPSDLDIITVYDYRHLDQPGRLELQFFNDRLYQLEFEPKDAEAYRTLFRRQWPQLGHERSGRSEYISGPLRIASSLDLAVSEVGRALHTRPFVLWQDLRLLRQRDDWNYQFAKAAAE